jgi:hypothetical protein
MISLISLNGNTVSVVNLPATSGAMVDVQFNFSTAVSAVTSVFTGQTQTQIWPGADAWSGTMTLPPMTQKQFNPWKAALMQMQGMSNALQLGDPLSTTPSGTVSGDPVVDGSIPVVAGGIVLYTRGWPASQIGLLLPGDMLQIGYRLHCVLDEVISDSSGKAPINIWPSLREVPIDGEAIVTTNPVGLFRLATNKGTWSSGVDHLSHMSFQISEFR